MSVILVATQVTREHSKGYMKGIPAAHPAAGRLGVSQGSRHHSLETNESSTACYPQGRLVFTGVKLENEPQTNDANSFAGTHLSNLTWECFKSIRGFVTWLTCLLTYRNVMFWKLSTRRLTSW